MHTHFYSNAQNCQLNWLCPQGCNPVGCEQNYNSTTTCPTNICTFQDVSCASHQLGAPQPLTVRCRARVAGTTTVHTLQQGPRKGPRSPCPTILLTYPAHHTTAHHTTTPQHATAYHTIRHAMHMHSVDTPYGCIAVNKAHTNTEAIFVTHRRQSKTWPCTVTLPPKQPCSRAPGCDLCLL
jgi:hypothetical protein